MENNEKTMMIQELNGEAKVQYTSFQPNTKEEKAKLFKAMTSADHKLSDMINNSIKIKDIFCEIIEMSDRETGEVKPLPKIVLFDEKNTSYSCVSIGIFNAVKNILSIFGTPDTWDEPVEVKVIQVTRGDRKLLSLDLK